MGTDNDLYAENYARFLASERRRHYFNLFRTWFWPLLAAAIAVMLVLP